MAQRLERERLARQREEGLLPVGSEAAISPVLADPPTRLGHVEALDGIRAVAVTGVLLFHGGVSWLPGGFLGVDVFFVLSGFLITTLLLGEIESTGGVALRSFWMRRVRRLLPALAVVVLAVAAFPALASPDRPVPSVRIDAGAALAYVANWRFVLAGGSYFEQTGAPSALLHTWSLAVEEQFYLAWPIVVALLARRGARLAVGVAAGAGALASAVTMAMLFRPGEDSSRAFYGTDARVHVILIGALLAVLLAGLRRGGAVPFSARAGILANAVAGCAVVGVAFAVARGSDAWLYRGGYAGVALATAAVIACVVVLPSNPVARVLAQQPLPALGRISYGVYLWHWPVFLAMTKARTGLGGTPLLTARIAVTIGLSVASAWLLERPIRTGRLLPGGWASLSMAGGGVVAAGVLFALAAWAPTGSSSTRAAAPIAAPGGLPAAVRPPRPPGTPAKVLIVGDSVGLTIGEGTDELGPKYGVRMINDATLGCGVARGGPFQYFGDRKSSPPECERWPDRWAATITKHDPDVVFMVIGRWEVMDRVHAGVWTRLGDPTFDAYIGTEIDTAIKTVTTRGARVALATAPYYLRGERPDGGRWPEDDPARVDRFNQLLREAAERHKDTTAIVDLNGRTSTGARYTKTVDGVQLRSDGVHFTPRGSRWLAPWLFPQLVALAPPVVGGATTTTLPGSSTSAPASTAARPRPPATTAPPTTRPKPKPSTTATTAPTTTEPPPPTTRPPTPTLPVDPG